MTEVASSDNSDLSEKEFQDNQTTDDGITASPKDFTEVSPESVGVRVKLDAALEFLKSLKGQDVEVSLASLTVSCDALRAGEQTINMAVDPDRAAALIAKSKSQTGVSAAGWTTGVVEMDRAIRFAAADWRDGDKTQQGQACFRDFRRACQDVFGQAGIIGVERHHRKTETDLEAAEPAVSGTRAHRYDRGHWPRIRRQARRVRQTDAVDRQSRHHHGG